MKANVLENEILSDNHLEENRDFLDYDEIIALDYKENSTKTLEVNATRNAIIFVLKGRKIFGASGEFTQNENEILFIKSGKFNAKNEAKNGKYQSYCIFFSNMFLLKFLSKHRYVLDLLHDTAKSQCHKIKSDVYISEQINSLSVYFNNKNKLNTNVFKEIIKLKTETLFLLLLNREDRVFSSYIWSIMESCPFLSILLQNSSIEFANVKEMAKFFDMNISIFSKKFKMSFGVSPKEWLDNEKFEKAKLLIEFSNKNITEICKELQINSIAWFIERFRTRYGSTPKQLQKSNNLYFGK